MSLNLQATTVLGAPLGGPFNFDVLTQVILYSSVAATSSFQLNFRGDSGTSFATAVPVGQTLEVLLLVTTGGTPYGPTAITIDGTTPNIIGYFGNPSWPTGRPNNVNQYPIRISHTAPGVFYVY